MLLINHDPVGVGADFLQQRVLVPDLGQAFLALDVITDQIHRARSKKRDQRDDVIDLPHIELFCCAGHTAGFHLEKANRFAAVVERK